MRRNFSCCLLICTLAMLSSCSKRLPILQGVDLKLWREDKNACAEIRTKTITAINNQKDKFLGLSEDDIVELLGRPDHNELYKRNQKFYYYWLQASNECNPTTNTEPLQLVIRFNAMGMAKEVSLEK